MGGSLSCWKYNSYVYIPAGSGPKGTNSVIVDGGGPVKQSEIAIVIRTELPLTTVSGTYAQASP